MMMMILILLGDFPLGATNKKCIPLAILFPPLLSQTVTNLEPSKEYVTQLYKNVNKKQILGELLSRNF